MRDTIDFGIDLGTTNSAMAVAQAGTVQVVKNNLNQDYTPSAVWMPKPGVVWVGDKARGPVHDNPENAAAEFKLEMGLADATRRFVRAGVTLSPTELSAEVLKALRADAQHALGTPPEAAVITVPAAFALHQTNATSDAARLAGFTLDCPLVQEPTAAAFAYGFQNATERAYWMVFDFGGGTFDAAIVNKRDGEMQIINHAGDPYLGGKLIDWAIVERQLAPIVAKEFGLTDFSRDNPAYQVPFAKLKAAAEELKISLSRTDSAEVYPDIRIGDVTEPFEFRLTRAELDQVANPFYLRAISRCRDALTEGGLTPADIDRLLLVGSPTLSPGLRTLLADPADGLGIDLDYSQDPATVVARGAALYANTVRLERPLAAPKAGEFTAELAYEPTGTSLLQTIAGRLHSATPVDWTTFSVVVRTGPGVHEFASARQALTADGTFLAEVQVAHHATTQFVVELSDAFGQRQKLTPDTLSITHTDVEFAGAVLTKSLGIGKADNTFAGMLAKGTTLPYETTQTFQTTIALKKSAFESMVRIPVLEGDRTRADRNQEIGVLLIEPKDVRIDLPAGSDVDVTLRVDKSRLITVVADIPLLGTQFEAELDMNNVRPPSPDELVLMLAEAEERLAELRTAAYDSAEARQRLEKLEQEDTLRSAHEQVRAAGVDPGAAATGEERVRDLQAGLDEIEEAAKLPSLIDDLQNALADCAEEVGESGLPADRRELTDIQNRAKKAIADRDATTIAALQERATDLYFDVRRRSPTWDAEIFQALRRMRDQMQPTSTADTLLWEGEQAIASGSYGQLPGVNQRLRRLLPADAPVSAEGGLKQRGDR